MLALVAAAFLNVYLASLLSLLCVVFVLKDSAKRQMVLHSAHAVWLVPYLLLLIVMPLVYANWLGFAVGIAMAAFFLIYLYFYNVMTRELFTRAIDLSLVISLLCAVIALIYRFTLATVEDRPESTFNNANYYGYAVELVLLMAFYRLYESKDRRHKEFFLLVIVVNLAALWASSCRSAWFSIFVGLAVLFAMNKRYKDLVTLVGVYILGIVLAFTFPTIFPRLDHMEFAKDMRVGIWLDAIAGIRQHPILGTGPMTFYRLSGGEYVHAHNMLFETMLSCGAVGLISVAIYFVLSGRDVIRQFRAGQSQGTIALLFAVAAATLVHGVTDVTTLWPQTGLILGLLLSTMGMLRREDFSVPVSAPPCDPS